MTYLRSDMCHDIVCGLRRRHGRRWITDYGRFHHQRCSIISYVRYLCLQRRQTSWSSGQACKNSNVATNVNSRSNKKQIDWDQLDREVSEKVDKEEEENLSGDARLNSLLKDIYDRADEVRTSLCVSNVVKRST